MAIRFKTKQLGFQGKKGVSAITTVQTSDGRVGFFHQVFNSKARSKSVRNGVSQPVYIDGELTKLEIGQVKEKYREKI